MTSDSRDVDRRGRAIGRLRTLTTAATVAGVAGTAGFGVLAAATWSGNPTASGANKAGSALTETRGSVSDHSRGAATGSGDDSSGIFGANGGALPGTSRGTAGSGSVSVPRIQPGTGRSHATTGGSG